MKHYSLLLSLFVLLSFTACDSPSLAGKEVKRTYYTGGDVQTEFIMDDKSGQNGLMRRYGYEGKVISTVQMRNGVKNGMEILYDQQGRAIRNIPYVNGRIHGTLKDLYENGTPMATLQYKNGVKNGIGIIYAKDGSVYRRLRYRNDRLVS